MVRRGGGGGGGGWAYKWGRGTYNRKFTVAVCIEKRFTSSLEGIYLN